MKSLITTFIFILCSIILFAQNIDVNPYPQDVEPTSLYIMWETDNSGNGFIDWGTSPFSLTQSVTSTSSSGSGNSRIHTAQLTGLNPNSKYYYQVRTASGITSLVYNVKTSPLKNSEESTRLVAMSDMQRDGGNPNKFNELVNQGVIDFLQSQGTGDLSDMVDALLIPGDLVPTGGIYSEWENYFFDPSNNLTPYTPIYPVLGNHEYFLSGQNNFKKYFQLPQNGTAGKEDEWWYKDISNIRVIGLNSNSGSGDQATQLTWLQNTLDAACNDVDIDFVFVELHHPHKSELWVSGEIDFTGDVITRLEDFSSNCGKPSIHFFGHTHGYSRGQSRDHNHLWVNVATAGGNIDYWGEYTQNDYQEFTKSQDEYGFVVLDVEAGSNPNFTLQRYSRGDENTTLNNVLRDEINIQRFENKPYKPIALFPKNIDVNPTCLTLKGNEFYDSENDFHQASHWQIASDNSNFEGTLVYDNWRQHENWFNEINTQANDDLTDEFVSSGLSENQTYYWRVRYRDEHLQWSDWSDVVTFTTVTNTINNLTSNLLQNNGAENNTSNWTGQIEALTAFECGSVSVFQGNQMFAVGGVCNNESTYGMASQDVDVSAFSSQIDNGGIFAKFGGYLRNYSGSDEPRMKVEFLDANNNSLAVTPFVSNTSPSWALIERMDPIPSGTVTIRTILEGFRNAGSDNDSYFDELSLLLQEGTACSDYATCLAMETLSDPINQGVLNVHVQNTILSTQTLTNGSVISYKAGDNITLEAGFCTSIGVDFEALIEACQ